jgi:hypothetical protein
MANIFVLKPKAKPNLQTFFDKDDLCIRSKLKWKKPNCSYCSTEEFVDQTAYWSLEQKYLACESCFSLMDPNPFLYINVIVKKRTQ